MAKKIIIALFVISVLFLGFTVGRYTNFLPMTKASWAAKSNSEFAKLDETESALALAIAASSPTIAKEMIKNLKRGNITKDAMQNVWQMVQKAGMGQGAGKQQRAGNERPTFEEEMKDIKEFSVEKDAFTHGAKDAPIKILVFTEFLCPFCSRVDPVISNVAKEYGEKKVNVTFQTFVVHGEKAAFWHRFAYAAGKQGKFFEVAEKLFATQKEWNRKQGDEAFTDVIEPMCKEFGLNLAKIKKDMESDDVKKMIDQESSLARELGVRGTPHVFINGRSFRGARDEAFYKKVIDQLLSEK